MIKSFLDNDLYKFTMMQAIFLNYSTTQVEYKFINRNPEVRFDGVKDEAEDKVDTPTPLFGAARFKFGLEDNISKMANLRLMPDQRKYLESLNIFNSRFLEWLSEFRLQPDQVSWKIKDDGQLDLKINGCWWDTILWEVPLMAIISGEYFMHLSTDWELKDQADIIKQKANELTWHHCHFSDFGTRRRRHFNIQDLVVGTMKNFKYFQGTSNVHLAMKHNVKPIGTTAHEWIMFHETFKGAEFANRLAMDTWIEVYRGKLGVALTDTYTTDVFLKNFDSYYARIFDGVRQDSKDPFEFVDKMVNHYKSLGIDPLSKFIIFSDSLNIPKSIKIQKYCINKINPFFGIGTNFTNDFKDSPPLNIVVKLNKVSGKPVVKLSDDVGKITGNAKKAKQVQQTLKLL